MPDQELRSLVRDCIAGNRSAQKRLYDRYAPAAWQTIQRYVTNGDVAGEILNDTFYKVFTRLDQFAFQGVFEGWIRKIAVNTITDQVRKNIRHDRMQGGSLDEEHAWIDNGPVERLTYKELLQFIHELPDTQRTVFNLNVFESLSHREIAALLGINETNSRWYLNSARKRLKEKIAHYMQ